MTMTRPLLIQALFLSGVLVTACGDRPARIEPRTEKAVSPHSVPASSPVRFQGRLVLEGTGEEKGSPAVFLSARRSGQRLPALSRKVEISSPEWKLEGDRRVLDFQLTDLDNMGGFGAPMSAEMEVEARYDPDGFIDPTPGAEEPGVVRAAVPANPGAKGLEIVLRLGTAK
jgi:hypothetical protein